MKKRSSRVTGISNRSDLDHFPSTPGNLDLGMQKEISLFITSNKVATLCCLDGKRPYCFNCFYHYHEASNLLLFKSSTEAYHFNLLTSGVKACGSILPESINFSALQGIQFWGTLVTDRPAAEIEDLYHQTFPFAEQIPGKVFAMALEEIKMTDNSMGFGRKLNWNREAEISLP